ncbi:tyrosine-type recombinase/integrase [Cryomorphaceae bacterium 1068]|nr:tyrosine-type recombinase/integrase [Cryomorphaceae bacterium 1068]
MAKPRFTLFGKSDDTAKMIKLVLHYKSKRFVYSTGIKVAAEDWNEKTERLRDRSHLSNRKAINDYLTELSARAEKSYYEMTLNNGRVDKEKLKIILTGENSQPETEQDESITSFLKSWIEKAEAGKIKKPTRNGQKNGGFSTLTIRQYKNTLMKIEGFQQAQKRTYKFSELDSSFYEAFKFYLEDSLELSTNTIGSRIKDLKSISRRAKKEGINVNEEVFTNTFLKVKEDVRHAVLDLKEINLLFNYPLQLDSTFDLVRDAFIIALWTGLRISDLKRLKPENIDHEKGFISIFQHKTGNQVILPISHQIAHTLNKRDGKLPRFISEQRFNEYLKEVCKLAGINKYVQLSANEPAKPKYELITSHTGRRSFATNAYHLGVDLLTIMNCTGHKSVAMLLKYINVSQEEHATTLQKAFAGAFANLV